MPENITPKPAPPLALPTSSSLVTIQAIDTTAQLYVKTTNFLRPTIPGHEAYNCPAMAFLIANQSTGRKVLFDCGVRKDFWNYSPLTYGRFARGVNVLGLRVDKGVDEVLVDAGVDLNSLESVLWRLLTPKFLELIQN